MKNVERTSSEETHGAIPPAADRRAMGVSLESGVQMLKEWQLFMQAGADLMSDNAKATGNDLHAFSSCRTTEDFSKASAAFSESLTTRWVDSGHKLARLSTDYAARRFQGLTAPQNTQHREG